jgi:hypothetical protein
MFAIIIGAIAAMNLNTTMIASFWTALDALILIATMFANIAAIAF